jgi:hypothetical protein
MKEITGKDGTAERGQEQGRLAADRRSFLKWAGAASGGALLPTGATGQAAAPAVTGGALYRETDHIRRYYELAR